MLPSGKGLTLRETADVLEIEPWRVSRLGRYLNIDPAAKCVPCPEVERMRQASDMESRYRALLHWLLEGVRADVSPPSRSTG